MKRHLQLFANVIAAVLVLAVIFLSGKVVLPDGQLFLSRALVMSLMELLKQILNGQLRVN